MISVAKLNVPRRAILLLGIAALVGSAGGCALIDEKELAPIEPPKETDYLLGAGDQVRVTTFADQQLSGEFRVDSRGDIAMPLIRSIHAGGSTPKQLEASIAAALKKAQVYKEPSVSVEVISYRPIFILGEVSKPGQYPFQPGMTVVATVAIAGGFTYRAVKDRFSIVRTSSDGSTAEGRASRETSITPGDVITVYERLF